jgi:hypothetical protein
MKSCEEINKSSKSISISQSLSLINVELLNREREREKENGWADRKVVKYHIARKLEQFSLFTDPFQFHQSNSSFDDNFVRDQISSFRNHSFLVIQVHLSELNKLINVAFHQKQSTMRGQ